MNQAAGCREEAVGLSAMVFFGFAGLISEMLH